MYIWLKCNECKDHVEVYCDGDNAMQCPSCRSIDTLTEEELNDEAMENHSNE